MRTSKKFILNQKSKSDSDSSTSSGPESNIDRSVNEIKSSQAHVSVCDIEDEKFYADLVNKIKDVDIGCET